MDHTMANRFQPHTAKHAMQCVLTWS